MYWYIVIAASGVITEEDIEEMEFEDSRKWTDRRLMETFGKMTAIEVQEHKDGENVERIRARYIIWLLVPVSGGQINMMSSQSNHRDNLDY